MSDIDVVIVHYSNLDDLAACLSALSGESLASLTIVDNASPSPVSQDLATRPGVRVIRLRENVGFGCGVNAGTKAGKAPLLLIVNPDVRILTDTLPKLRTALAETASVVAVGPRLLLENGALQVGAAGYFPTYGAVAAHSFPPLRWLPATWTGRPLFLREADGIRLRSQSLTDVDWISGACLLVRRSAFEAVGGFDERFFMYGEDIDLCRRFSERQWQVRYCPEAAVVHAQRALGSGWIDGLDQYYRIHAPRARRALHGILAVGLGARSLAYAVKMGSARSGGRGASRRMARYAWYSVRRALGL